MIKTLLKTFIFFAVVNLSAQDITSGLVFNLNCDSSTDLSDGDTLTESSASLVAGTIVGSVTSIEDADGEANGAFYFDGSSYINFDATEIANLPSGDVSTDGRTFSIWIKTSTQTLMQAFSYGNGSRGEHVHLNVNQGGSAGRLNLGHWNIEASQATYDGSSVDDQWHHIVAVVNKTAAGYDTSYYIDNVFVETVSNTNGYLINTTYPTETSYVDFRLGARNDSTTSYALGYTGGIDDFRIYSRSLSVNDINALYNVGSSTLSTSKIETVEAFNVYPTVASDILNITLNVDLKQLYIVDVNGVTVKNIKTDSKEVNVSNLASGMYFIVGKSDTGLSTSKFIKK